MCVVGNYRLQDIQLSKNSGAIVLRRLQKLSSASLALACQAVAPRRMSAFALRAPAGQPSQTHAGRRLVENTGLEPVTSWLQTRRSPS